MTWEARYIINRLAHVTIFVRDEDEALSFYTEKLGLEKRADVIVGPGMRWLTVAPAGQTEVEIVLHRPGGWHDEATAEKLEERIGQGTIWVCNTDYCHKAYSTLKSRGVRFLSAPEERQYGLEAIFEDLYCNVFSLLEPRLR